MKRLPLVVLFLLGCSKAPSIAKPQGVDVVLDIVPRVYTVQSIVHHWASNDVYQYQVTLKKWNGASYVDLVPPLVVTLPQKGTVKSTTAFTNLQSGAKYQAGVVAQGNVGGTSPATTLNSQVPTTMIFDFSGSQNIQNTVQASLSVTFDPVPFSGTSTLSQNKTPAGTKTYSLTLVNSSTGQTVYQTSYALGKVMTLSSLKEGINYTVTVKALKGNGSQAGIARSTIYFCCQDVQNTITTNLVF